MQCVSYVQIADNVFLERVEAVGCDLQQRQTYRCYSDQPAKRYQFDSTGLIATL